MSYIEYAENCVQIPAKELADLRAALAAAESERQMAWDSIASYIRERDAAEARAAAAETERDVSRLAYDNLHDHAMEFQTNLTAARAALESLRGLTVHRVHEQLITDTLAALTEGREGGGG